MLDSLTPRFEIGAVWLRCRIYSIAACPDRLVVSYRRVGRGDFSRVVALACYAIAHLVLRVSGSHAAAAIAVAMFALSPDVLYLQSTPMTEPLLFGLVLWSISLVYDWVEGAKLNRDPFSSESREKGSRFNFSMRKKAGWCLVLACLTRYEAWLVTAAVLVLASVALWRRGLSFPAALKATAHLATYPVLAIVAFFFHSWFTTGAWFVAGGFFVSDNVATGNAWKAFTAVVYGANAIGSPSSAGARGVLLVFARGLSRTRMQRRCGPRAACVMVCRLCLLQRPPVSHALMVAPSVGAACLPVSRSACSKAVGGTPRLPRQWCGSSPR